MASTSWTPPGCRAAPSIRSSGGSIVRACLTSAWEKQATAQREQRPPRRYYEITGAGEAMLADAIGRFRALDKAVSPRRLKPSRA